METATLKKFAQQARRELISQVKMRLERVLLPDSLERREHPAALDALQQQLAQGVSKDSLAEKVAYTWFNRFCALRFMDVQGYTRVRVVSPSSGELQPEILSEAKGGHVDTSIVEEKTARKILDLLREVVPSDNPQAEAYRLLLVSACNHWHQTMPFLFEAIDDATELLLPHDLLSSQSILAQLRDALTPENCQDVEVIGWLYQFYISEKKDEVFEGFKKNIKATPQTIPAATQLFTPHWIVRYLVENSLGRLWMLNHPHSRLPDKMEYYIQPEQPETDFLHVSNPEDIRVCDPACGSGHMLSYAYDLLKAIYEEQGYARAAIPGKILEKNLFGIEIDERAAQLSSFVLAMKARSDSRSFFRNPVKPNVCVLDPLVFPGNSAEERFLVDSLAREGIPRAQLLHDLQLFAEANQFGSLLRPQLAESQLEKASQLLQELRARTTAPTMLQGEAFERGAKILDQARFLASKYHVVIANPPYMGGKKMNTRLSKWAEKNYPISKSDFFSMFIERGMEMVHPYGYNAMVTMQSWMFLSTYEKLRAKLLEEKTILSMIHLGPRAFDSIGGEVVSTTAFVLSNAHFPRFKGDFIRLVEGNSEEEKQKILNEALS